MKPGFNNGIGPQVTDNTTLGQLSKILSKGNGQIKITRFLDEYSVMITGFNTCYRGYDSNLTKAISEAVDDFSTANDLRARGIKRKKSSLKHL